MRLVVGTESPLCHNLHAGIQPGVSAMPHRWGSDHQLDTVAGVELLEQAGDEGLDRRLPR
jgi:hypothetical protein